MSATRKILSEGELHEWAAGHRRAGRTIVLSNGGFDLLHVGHLRALEEAKRVGDVLVVAVNEDATVRAAKGPPRPVVPVAERAELVAALSCVDHVITFADETADRLLEALHPDVYAKGRDYTLETLPERGTVERLGIRAVFVGDPKEHSSSDLVRRLASGGAPAAEGDRVHALDLPDVRGFVLRRARPVLAAAGWLDLERLATTKEGRHVEGGERRFVRRIEIDGTGVYVKVTRPAERKRSPIVEFQNHLALRAAGFRAPEPWLCMEGRSGGKPTGVLVTREAAGEPLDAFLAAHHDALSPRARLRAAAGVGLALRALHTARFFHPDLQAWHLLVDGRLERGRPSLVFLDLMRLARGGPFLPRKKAAVGLAALALSLRPVVPARFRLGILRAYLGGTLRAARPWLEAIEKRIRRIEGRGTFRDVASRPASERPRE